MATTSNINNNETETKVKKVYAIATAIRNTAKNKIAGK